MNSLLTPLAILVLAATQIPAWQNAASEVRCRESLETWLLSDGENADLAHGVAHHTCRGGVKYAAVLERL